MRIISIINQKGGVGKTVTAINLSACLADKDKKVLLIDLDPQANATLGLNINPYELEYTIYNILINPEHNLKGIIQNTSLSNLSIAPSHMNLSGCDVELASELARPYLLRNALKILNSDYDYVIIDCPPSLGVLSLNALLASTDMIIPIEPKFYALAGMDILNRMIVKIKEQLNHQLNLLGVLITMFDPRTNLHSVISEKIHDYFGPKVFKTIINLNIKLSEAETQKIPVTKYDPSSSGAQNYIKLTEEILEIEQSQRKTKRGPKRSLQGVGV